jgi:hypothetical protein
MGPLIHLSWSCHKVCWPCPWSSCATQHMNLVHLENDLINLPIMQLLLTAECPSLSSNILHWHLVLKFTSNDGSRHKHLCKVMPASFPPVGVAVRQAMECWQWASPQIACKKGLTSLGSVHHWMEISTPAHHVKTAPIHSGTSHPSPT